MRAARQADVHLIKNEIHKYYDFEPAILNVLKTSLGYSHPATGMLLCPAHLNWSDERSVSSCCLLVGMSNTVERFSVQERLRRGDESPNADTLFYFMYSANNCPPSPNSLNRGLLRSPMLIKVSC